MPRVTHNIYFVGKIHAKSGDTVGHTTRAGPEVPNLDHLESCTSSKGLVTLNVFYFDDMGIQNFVPINPIGMHSPLSQRPVLFELAYIYLLRLKKLC